jgi:hypothetical protein
MNNRFTNWFVLREERSVLFKIFDHQVWVKFGYLGMPFYTVSLEMGAKMHHYHTYKSRRLALRHAGRCCRFVGIKLFLETLKIPTKIKAELYQALEFKLLCEEKVF